LSTYQSIPELSDPFKFQFAYNFAVWVSSFSPSFARVNFVRGLIKLAVMATELMARSQIMSSSIAMPTSAGGLPRSGAVVRATGLKALPPSSAPLRQSVNSKGMFTSCERSRARSVTRSVLEAPQVEQSDVTGSALNPAEVLIEKLAALGAPNDSELHKMSELADRLFSWDDVPKLGTWGGFTVLNLRTTLVIVLFS